MLYGAETWRSKKSEEKKLDVTEMRMLRWTCGVTKLDKIRNERIRGTVKVTEISKNGAGEKTPMEWARDEKGGGLRGKKSDGNGSSRHTE